MKELLSDKNVRIYGWPIIIYLAIFLFLELLIVFYFNITVDGIKTKDLFFSAIVTLLTTSSGIFVPLLINRNWQKSDDRRTLGFSLGLVWHELLYNDYVLKEIEGNLDLDEIYSFTGITFPPALHSYKARVDTLILIGNILHSDSFNASQNSGAIKTYNDDELFTSVIEAHQSIKDVILSMHLLQGNATKNSFVLSKTGTIAFDKVSEDKIKELIRKDIENTKKKTISAISKVTTAISQVGSALDKLGIKLTIT